MVLVDTLSGALPLSGLRLKPLDFCDFCFKFPLIRRERHTHTHTIGPLRVGCLPLDRSTLVRVTQLGVYTGGPCIYVSIYIYFFFLLQKGNSYELHATVIGIMKAKYPEYSRHTP